MRIESTAAIVTGAASGLGEATARSFAEMGAEVTLLDRDADRGAAVADEIGGGRVRIERYANFFAHKRPAFAWQGRVPDDEPEMPEDIVMLRIDPRTGLLADAATEDAIFEVFRAEDAPGTNLGTAGRDSGVKRQAVVPPPTQDLF